MTDDTCSECGAEAPGTPGCPECEYLWGHERGGGGRGQRAFGVLCALLATLGIVAGAVLYALLLEQ